ACPAPCRSPARVLRRSASPRPGANRRRRAPAPWRCAPPPPNPGSLRPCLTLSYFLALVGPMTDQAAIDHAMMTYALAIARAAGETGEAPIGAVVVDPENG